MAESPVKVYGDAHLAFDANCVEVHIVNGRPSPGGHPTCIAWHAHHTNNVKYIVMSGVMLLLFGELNLDVPDDAPEEDRISLVRDMHMVRGQSFVVAQHQYHCIIFENPCNLLRITWSDKVHDDVSRLRDDHVIVPNIV